MISGLLSCSGLLSRQPGFEQCGGLGALHAAAHCVQDAATRGDMSVKTEPIGNVQFKGFAGDFQVQITNFEEALLKDDAESLLAQEGLGVSGLQGRRDIISSVNTDEIGPVRYAREGEEIQGTVDGINGEKGSMRGAAHVVLHAIKPVGNVNVCNSP